MTHRPLFSPTQPNALAARHRRALSAAAAVTGAALQAHLGECPPAVDLPDAFQLRLAEATLSELLAIDSLPSHERTATETALALVKGVLAEPGQWRLWLCSKPLPKAATRQAAKLMTTLTVGGVLRREVAHG